MIDHAGTAIPIEQLAVGDWILSRSENDPNGTPELKRAEAVFVRVGRILHIHVKGQVIRTTTEHPFWVASRGEWLSARRLEVGDVLVGYHGQLSVVQDILDTGEYETVYNVRIADYHTYFVGGREWNFSVWAHNTCGIEVLDSAGRTYRVPHGFKTYEEYHNFVVVLDTKIQKLDPAAKAFMQGSAVTGVEHDAPHRAFDVGRRSDFDVAIMSSELIARAEKAGVKVKDAGFGRGKYTQPLDKPELVKAMGLDEVATVLSTAYDRKVNFIVYESAAAIYKNPSMQLEKLK